MKAGTPWKAMTIFWTTWARTRTGRILFVFKVKNYLHAAASESKHRWSHKAEGLTGLIQPKPSLTAEERNSTYWVTPLFDFKYYNDLAYMLTIYFIHGNLPWRKLRASPWPNPPPKNNCTPQNHLCQRYNLGISYLGSYPWRRASCFGSSACVWCFIPHSLLSELHATLQPTRWRGCGIAETHSHGPIVMPVPLPSFVEHHASMSIMEAWLKPS